MFSCTPDSSREILLMQPQHILPWGSDNDMRSPLCRHILYCATGSPHSCGFHGCLYCRLPVGGTRASDKEPCGIEGWPGYISFAFAATLICYEMGAECALQAKRRCITLRSSALSAGNHGASLSKLWRMSFLPRVERVNTAHFSQFILELSDSGLHSFSVFPENEVGHFGLLHVFLRHRKMFYWKNHMWNQRLFSLTSPPPFSNRTRIYAQTTRAAVSIQIVFWDLADRQTVSFNFYWFWTNKVKHLGLVNA